MTWKAFVWLNQLDLTTFTSHWIKASAKWMNVDVKMHFKFKQTSENMVYNGVLHHNGCFLKWSGQQGNHFLIFVYYRKKAIDLNSYNRKHLFMCITVIYLLKDVCRQGCFWNSLKPLMIFIWHMWAMIRPHVHGSSYNRPSAAFGPCKWFDSKQALHQTGFQTQVIF